MEEEKSNYERKENEERRAGNLDLRTENLDLRIEKSNYENLLVWQKAMNLVEQVYLKTKMFPKEELYGITSQLRRATLSIPLNIVEGQGREGKKEFKRFLFISRGSAYEVSTIFQVCLKLNYISQEEYQLFYCEVNQIIKMLGGLIRRTKN